VEVLDLLALHKQLRSTSFVCSCWKFANILSVRLGGSVTHECTYIVAKWEQKTRVDFIFYDQEQRLNVRYFAFSGHRGYKPCWRPRLRPSPSLPHWQEDRVSATERGGSFGREHRESSLQKDEFYPCTVVKFLRTIAATYVMLSASKVRRKIYRTGFQSTRSCFFLNNAISSSTLEFNGS
jgi:hypothetical protein